jgi:hypothetical protein
MILESRRDILITEKKHLGEVLFLICHHSGYKMIRDLNSVKLIVGFFFELCNNFGNTKNDDNGMSSEHQAVLASLTVVALVDSASRFVSSQQVFGSIYKDISVVRLLQNIKTVGFSGIARLVLGLLSFSAGNENDSVAFFRDACKLKVFSFIRIRIVGSLFFRDSSRIMKDVISTSLDRVLLHLVPTLLLTKSKLNICKEKKNINYHDIRLIKLYSDDEIVDLYMMAASISRFHCCHFTSFAYNVLSPTTYVSKTLNVSINQDLLKNSVDTPLIFVGISVIIKSMAEVSTCCFFSNLVLNFKM